MKRVALACDIRNSLGVYNPMLKQSPWHLLVMSIMSMPVRISLLSKTFATSNYHAPTDHAAVGSLCSSPGAKLSGFTDVNYLCLLLISCLQSVMLGQ